MKFTMQVDMDNAAFEDDQAPAELARILRVAAGQVEQGVDAMWGADRLSQRGCTDLNGNLVGLWIISQ